MYLSEISKNKVFALAQRWIVKTQITNTKFGKLFFPINRYVRALPGTVPGAPWSSWESTYVREPYSSPPECSQRAIWHFNELSIKVLLYPQAKKWKKHFFSFSLFYPLPKERGKIGIGAMSSVCRPRFFCTWLTHSALSLWWSCGSSAASLFPTLTRGSGSRDCFLRQPVLIHSKALLAVIKYSGVMAGTHCAQIHVLLLS